MSNFLGIVLLFTCTSLRFNLRCLASNCCERTVYFVQQSVCDAKDIPRSQSHLQLSLNNVNDNKPIRLNLNFRRWEQLYIKQEQLLPRAFPVDPDKANFVRHVKNALFSEVHPCPLKSELRLAAVSYPALQLLLDLSTDVEFDKDFVRFVGGSYVPKGSTPLAHRYGGHQFGDWAGQLGDGRAVSLGEYTNWQGERWELQLKGSGKTPYSRRGDGRAVLRSSVREFLASEALFHLVVSPLCMDSDWQQCGGTVIFTQQTLSFKNTNVFATDTEEKVIFTGIPSSRAVSLVVSDDPVIRDPFYDGNVVTERAAVVLRLAPSWFRTGSLELLTYNGEIKLLRQVADFVIDQHFPGISSKDPNKYVAWFAEIVNQTASLISQWQSVGFAHGVCNTDNFSLLSLTIDFGPFGFLDRYDPSFVPNTSDDEGRYSYENQPDVGYFNLNKLRIAILPLLGPKQKDKVAEILQTYPEHYRRHFMHVYGRKLGIALSVGDEDDEDLVAVLLKIMQETKADFTMSFRNLGEITMEDLTRQKISAKLWALQELSQHEWFSAWTKLYNKAMLTRGSSDSERRVMMLGSNPRYILRNWIAQNAISKAEKNDFSYLRKVLHILEQPYVKQEEAEILGFGDRPPSWAPSLKVSCSS